MAARNASTPTPRLVAFKKAFPGLTGVPYTSGRDLVHRGELPIIKIGTAWYVALEDINAWIDANKSRHGAA